jgi:hypothetical protein
MTTLRLSRSFLLAACAAAVAFAGCRDDGQAATVVPPAADAGAPDASAPAGLAGPALAIVASDHKSTSVSLYMPGAAAITRERCLDSGSTAPMLSAALSGDVVLPSQPQPNHQLVLIDRKSGALTWLDPATCTVLRQVNVGAWSNPQDIVTVGAKSYVTRYNANPGNMAEGSDVLVIDAATGTTLKAIDLRPSASESLTPGKTILPFPTRAVQLGGLVYVVLNDLSPDFDAAGMGRVVVIDPATDAVTGAIDLPGLANCGGLAVTPGQPAGLAVACGGPFSDGPKQIDSAGVAWITDPTAMGPLVTSVKAPAFTRPVSGFDVLVQSRGQLFTVVAGDFMGPAKDALWSFSMDDPMPAKVFEAGESFVLSAFLDRDGGKLYALDATKTDPRVRVFTLAAGAAPTKSAEFAASPVTGLPPQQMAWY